MRKEKQQEAEDCNAAVRNHIDARAIMMLERCNNLVGDKGTIAYVAPSFRATHDGLPTATCRRHFIDSLKRHLKTMPDFHLEVLNSSSEVDEERGKGTVFVFFRLTGVGNHLERESVAVMQWEKRHGEWLCIKHEGMRGPSGFPNS